MYIYNITTKVSWQVQEDWLKWMKEKHIPDIMQTGCFTEYRFSKLLEQDDNEGPTYAMMLFADSLDQYQQYLDQFAPSLRKEAQANWGNAIIGFRSLMQLVH
jgi:hypothetical protein